MSPISRGAMIVTTFSSLAAAAGCVVSAESFVAAGTAGVVLAALDVASSLVDVIILIMYGM